MGILIEDMGSCLDSKKYPIISRLYEGGVNSLFEFAKGLGFIEADGYVSKCELCFDIRKFIANKDQNAFFDLTPKSFYMQDY